MTIRLGRTAHGLYVVYKGSRPITAPMGKDTAMAIAREKKAEDRLARRLGEKLTVEDYRVVKEKVDAIKEREDKARASHE